MRQSRSDRGHGMLLGDVLRSMTAGVLSRPWLTLFFTLVSCVACAAVTATQMEFKTDRADLIDPAAPFQKRWLDYTESFSAVSDMVIAVEAESPEAIKELVDAIAGRLEAEPKLFSNVLAKVEPGGLQEKGLQYLPPELLVAGLERLQEYRPVLQGRWELLQLDSLIPRLRHQIAAHAGTAASGNNAAGQGTTGTAPNGSTPNGNALGGTAPQTAPTGNTSAGMAAAEWEGLLQHARLLAVSLERFLADRSDFRSPWPDMVPVDASLRHAARQAVYFLNDRGTMGFLKAAPVEQPDETNGPIQSITRLRSILEELEQSHPQARLGLTGIPVLETDEMLDSQTDMFRASVISLIAVALILLVGFRGFRHPALAMVMLAVGLIWAFGYTTLSVGHLNILSVSFAAILIGLGIDFAVHYLAKYLELRHQGASMQSALLDTSHSVGPGIITAAVTTALAFLCTTLTSFLGVGELGIIAGGGILLCAAASFLVLPPMIALADRKREHVQLPYPFEGSGLRTFISRHPLLVLALSLALVFQVGRQAVRNNQGEWKLNVKYDYNLLNLQAEGLESVEVQRRIFQEADGSLLYAVSVADTPEEARQLRHEFEKLPSVHHVDELASRLPPHPPESTELLVQGFHALLSNLQEPPRVPAAVNPADLGKELEQLWNALRVLEHPQAQAAAQAIDDFLNAFDQRPLPDQMRFLQEYQGGMTAALYGQLRALSAASNPDPVTLGDLPDALTSRFVSPEGKWLLQVYPSFQVWDIKPLTRFVDDVRSVDPNATGTPLQNFEASQQIMQSYQQSALYALLVITVVLVVDFLDRAQAAITLLLPLAVLGSAMAYLNARGMAIEAVPAAAAYVGMVLATAAVLDVRSFRDTMLALLPPLAGCVMMLGILAVQGVDFNPANLIVLPLVVGIGVDDGVHVIHDFRLQTGRYRLSASTTNAIVLTSLTTMIGFGSMMIASHRGLYSLGLVLFVGVGCCLLVSLVMLPAALTICDRLQVRYDNTHDDDMHDRRRLEARQVTVLPPAQLVKPMRTPPEHS